MGEIMSVTDVLLERQKEGQQSHTVGKMAHCLPEHYKELGEHLEWQGKEIYHFVHQ